MSALEREVVLGEQGQSQELPLLRLWPVPSRTAADAPDRLEAVELRPAGIADVPEIVALIAIYARQNLLLHRGMDQIYRNLREFHVAVGPAGLLGCVSLRVYSSDLAEVGALAVAESCRGLGIGGRLVEVAVEEATRLGIARVFALTLRDAFFHRLGFRTLPIGDLPQKVAEDCAGCPKRECCDEIAVLRDLRIDPVR